MPAVNGKRRKSGRSGAEGKGDSRPGSSENETQYFSRAVAKSLELLQILEHASQPLPLNQLATKVRLTKPSAFRLLYTLETTGYVVKGDDARYELNQDVRKSVRDRLISTVLAAAGPLMRELTREFRETTSLAVLFDNHIEVVGVVESPQTIRMGNTVGRILQPHASSLGKCVTAFQPEARREHLLRSYGISSYTQNTITDERALHEEFAQIREAGYAKDRGETCLEGHCFGAPIRNSHGEVVAAVSMSMPWMRLGDEEQQRRITTRLVETARAIEVALDA